LAERIENYAKYPTLSSLLADLPFPAKKALFQTLIKELEEKKDLEGKMVLTPTQDQKLTKILRRLTEPEVQEAIRKAYELSYWVDLDFLGDLVKALKTREIKEKESFLEILKERGLSTKTIQEELAKTRGEPPQHFSSDRLAAITREKQSPQPLQQSVAEAVSNSIDAIWTKHGQERSIGQWGRGIKMLLSYLDHPQDSIIVTTTQNNETWQIEIKKGGNGRFYLRSSKIEFSFSSQQSSQEPKQSGTTLILKKHQPLNQDFLEQLKGRLKKRFRFTPEVEIRINDELINQYENLIDVKTNQSMERHGSLGNVNVSLTPKEIVIEDNGCGMSPDQLLSMFIAGAGSKPFVEITDKNRESFLPLVEVFYEHKLAEKKPTAENIINFSRNRETILSLPLSSDQINLFDKPLFFELGPLLESSDAREGVKINKNFQEAVKKAVDIIVEGEIDPKQKIAILNSLVAGLTSLGGREYSEKKTDVFTTISNIISYTHTKAQPLITDLSLQGYLFIPNYQEFSNLKLADDPKTIFINPLLFSFVPEKLNLPGFEQVSPSIFQSSTGKKLFLADFKDEAPPIISYRDGFIIDRKLWKKILSLKAENPHNFQVLVEALELRLNLVSTSYDPHEKPLTNLQNRLIFEEKKEEETKQETIEWPGWLSNKQKGELANILKDIKEVADYGGWIYPTALSSDGKKLFYGGMGGKLMMVDLESCFFLENYQEKLTNLTKLAEKIHAFFPYPQTIVNSLGEFFSDKRNLKIANLNQIINWLNNEKNTTFIQNLSNLLPPEINQLNEEEKNKVLTRLLTNILEISFKLSTLENTQITLPNLFTKDIPLLLNFSLINLQQDQDVLKQITELISPEDNFFQKQLYFSLINGFFSAEKDAQKRQVFLDKLSKIKNHPSYQKYLQLVTSYSEEEITDLFSKEVIEREIPGRSLIEFLKKDEGIALTELSLTGLENSWEITEQNQSVFQRPISIAEILYQYKIKRLRNWQEVVGAINQTSTTAFNLELFRQEIMKEVSGQAIEEGVARREMIQNGVDAIKNRQEITEGKIDIRLVKAYDDKKDEYLIEEFTDQGTGIVD